MRHGSPQTANASNLAAPLDGARIEAGTGDKAKKEVKKNIERPSRRPPRDTRKAPFPGPFPLSG